MLISLKLDLKFSNYHILDNLISVAIALMAKGHNEKYTMTENIHQNFANNFLRISRDSMFNNMSGFNQS